MPPINLPINLGTILKLLNPAVGNLATTGRTGNWGTTEYGLTEDLANKISGGNTSDLLNAVSGNYNNPTSYDYSDARSTGGQIQGVQDLDLGDTTGGTPTGGTPTGEGADVSGLTFEAVLREANKQRANAKAVLQTILDSVGKYRDTSKEFYNNAGQSIINNAGEQLGMNARTGQDLASTLNRSARNLGLSGRIQAGQGLMNKLAATQGSTLATKGENEANNLTDYNYKLGTADTREEQAGNAYQQALDAATSLEENGLADYATNLNNVQERNNALASVGILNPGEIKPFTPSTNITSYLNGLVPTNTNGVVSNANQNPVSGEQSVNLNDLIKKLIGYGYSQ